MIREAKLLALFYRTEEDARSSERCVHSAGGGQPVTAPIPRQVTGTLRTTAASPVATLKNQMGRVAIKGASKQAKRANLLRALTRSCLLYTSPSPRD